MDQQTVADLLGVGYRMVSIYCKEKGLPQHGRGREKTFVWSEVREWYVGYRMLLETGDGSDGSGDADSDDLTSDSGEKKPEIRKMTLRKLTADTHIKELQLSKARGEVISLADLRPRLDRAFGNLATNLRTVGPKIVNRLEGITDRAQKEQIAKEELDNLALELSTGAFVQVETDAATNEEAEGTLEEVSAAADFPEKIPTNLETLLACAEILELYDEL